MTEELAGLPSLPAMPLDAQDRWRVHFECIEQLPVLSPDTLRILEQDLDGNPLTEGRDALLEDWDFWDRYCELLSKGATRAAAARSLGVPPALVQSLFRELGAPLPDGAYDRIATVRRREKIAAVAQQVITAEGQLELKYVGILHDAAIVRGDTKVAQYLLERRFKDQWAPNKSVVHKGEKREGAQSVGATVIQGNQVNILSMSDEQLASMDRGGLKGLAPRKVAIPGKVVDVGGDT